ncbi:unnamed protein product [Lepeophtheirus salmonis]|uniref:(salmon louse) hypothetical protein n=1 Tax=Lepeophtheirus salmonis TaxID=72036 RepID=A0A7R8CHV5_LEPSM|nr:unnamed protein product [Lepeophtheirus salmonis]CAF2789680.1 unnamed protein product [Lepeophtheirus salmonis]
MVRLAHFAGFGVKTTWPAAATHDNSAPYTRNGLWEVMSSMTMSMTRLNTNPEIATPWRIHDPKPTNPRPGECTLNGLVIHRVLISRKAKEIDSKDFLECQIASSRTKVLCQRHHQPSQKPFEHWHMVQLLTSFQESYEGPE